MRTLVAFPSTASFGQQAALAFHERGALAAYATAFAYHPDGALGRFLKILPPVQRHKLELQLMRRTIASLPPDAIEQRPFWEVVRTLAGKVGASTTVVDRIWDHLSVDFTRHVARRVLQDVDAVYAYEYTALEAFQAAKKRGVAAILDFPSLNGRHFEELQRREKARHPELNGRHEAYFESRFALRQARRDAEMALADVIVTNSSITRDSHIAGGADPEKIFAVPYGAPPTIRSIRERAPEGPLKVVWAGSFSIRKGAHYFLQAWRAMRAEQHAIADVYGALVLPGRLWQPAPTGITFHGSVIRQQLFDAFEAADVLIFPTLSDGFGMVVTEAFACGLPVITTNQAGAADLVKHQQNGLLIPAGDPDAIARALEWCLDNRERLREMRTVALQTAKNWQWTDYRRLLIETVSVGLTRAAFRPTFSVPLRVNAKP